MEYLLAGIGLILVLVGIIVKLLHKVKPNHVTVIELWGGKKVVTLQKGLYVLINLPPFIEIKSSNLYMGTVNLGPLVGLEEEGWDNDWQNRPAHPNPGDLNFDIIPGVEFSDGSTALVELVLPLKIKSEFINENGLKKKNPENPIEKFLYDFERPVSTIVDIAKAVTRAAAAQYSFNEAIKDKAKELREEILTNISDSMQKLDTGLELVIQDNNDTQDNNRFRIIKNFYPCPETKKARSDLYEAKQQGKSLKEIAKGESEAEILTKTAKGEGIKLMAENAGVSSERSFDYEVITATTGNLKNSTFIQASGEDGSLMGNVVKMIGIGKSMSTQPQKKDTERKEENNG